MRPLESGPYTFLAANALVLKVCEGGRVVNVHASTDVVGIFPDRAALIRLGGAVLAEPHDERVEARRYLGLRLIQQSHTAGTTPAAAIEQGETNPDLALSAEQSQESRAATPATPRKWT